MYKTKSSEKAVAVGANEILRNGTIAVLLNYLSNFWRSFKIPLINNSKVNLKHKWSKHCVLASTGTENADDNSENSSCTIKDTKLYVTVMFLSANGNQKLSKFLSRRFEKSVYQNEYKTKSEIRGTKNKYSYFLESIFGGVKRYLC